MRHIQVFLRHIEPYSNIFTTLCNPCVYNRAILRPLTYLEPKVSSKARKMMTHIENYGIVRTVYSIIFKDI